MRERSLYRPQVMPATLRDEETPAGVIITHPNRDKPAVQATRATVVALLLASAGLVLIVTVGGRLMVSVMLIEPLRPSRSVAVAVIVCTPAVRLEVLKDAPVPI